MLCPSSSQIYFKCSFRSLNTTTIFRCMELYRARSWALKSLPLALSACKNSQLKRINMIETEASEETIAEFFGSLNTIHFLTELCVERTYLGIQECEALGNLLTNSESKLEMLQICEAQLDDERMICLGNALSVNKTLKYLDLHLNNDSISLEGWQGTSQCLRNPDTALETLRFSDSTDADDEEATDKVAAMVRALERNSTLKRLNIGCTSYGYDINITENWVWELFNRVLCDKTSIINTYASKHTLHSFMISGSHWYVQFDKGKYSEVRESIMYSMNVNLNDDKAEVAREKILKHHFAGESAEKFTVFASMPESVLAHAIAWIGRDKLGHSLMYEFVRTFPHLLSTRIVPDDAAGKKRKR